jgi:hypothetical protein
MLKTKTVFLFLFFFFLGNNLFSQKITTDCDTYQIKDLDNKPILFIDSIEIKYDEVLNYINNNKNWTMQVDCMGKVIVSFVIDSTGNAINHKFEKKICGPHDDETMRVIKTLTDWKPGIKNGKPVNTKVVFTIIWKLQ